MNQVRRGTILAFNSSAWTATVLLDGADAESTIPVGQWVPATMLVANAEVAVLVFGAGSTDTDDGVVLGAYGAVGTTDTPTFAALNVGAATGATTGQGKFQPNGSGVGLYVINGTVSAGASNPSPLVRLEGHAWNSSTGDTTISADLQAAVVANNVNPLVPKLSVVFGGTEAAYFDSGANLNLAAGGKLKVAATQVVGARQTGWTAPTATLSRTAITNADTLAQTISHLAALVTDLTTHGLIGP